MQCKLLFLFLTLLPLSIFISTDKLKYEWIQKQNAISCWKFFYLLKSNLKLFRFNYVVTFLLWVSLVDLIVFWCSLSRFSVCCSHYCYRCSEKFVAMKFIMMGASLNWCIGIIFRTFFLAKRKATKHDKKHRLYWVLFVLLPNQSNWLLEKIVQYGILFTYQ